MPWINHLPPVCWSTFGILVWNDSGYVNLTQWWYFFIIFEYILHISTPHIMVFCFPLPYFPLSTSALFFAKYSCTHIVYRRSLVTFYWAENVVFCFLNTLSGIKKIVVFNSNFIISYSLGLKLVSWHWFGKGLGTVQSALASKCLGLISDIRWEY